MNSPYSSSLLQEPTRPGAPSVDAQVAAPSRSITRVQAAPVMMPAAPPQVVYVPVQAAPSRITPVALALVILLLGAAAAAAGYYGAQQATPSPAEAGTVQQLAAMDGFFAGRQRGEQLGRADGYEAASRLAATRTAIANQRAWNQGFTKGLGVGESSYRSEPAYTGGYGGGYSGYRGYRGSWGGGAVAGALWQAQNLADATGSPVDVEVY